MSAGSPASAQNYSISSRLQLWVAQGFWVGRIPFAPGTFGSIVGFLWFWVLLASGSWQLLLAGTFSGLVTSVWLCGNAEKLLGKRDPGSVVLDEIVAIPLCLLGWTLMATDQLRALPDATYFLSAHQWPWLLAAFVLFRFFDIVKPWPVHQSQRLPGGLGITADDALAAIYVNIVLLLGRRFISF